MGLRAIILGCGSSGGVPRVGGDWGACNPNQVKNRRTRSSILVQAWEGDSDAPTDPKAMTTILVDTSPDLREQCLAAGVKHLDALLYTHDHADQSHGIDDLRAIAYRMRKQVPTYMDAHTKEHVFTRFQYCFEMPDGRVHPPILELQPLIKGGDEIMLTGAGGDVSVRVIELSHGPTPSLGFIFNDQIAYTPDVWDIADPSMEMLSGINTWIVDALRYNDHPTHANADKTLSWIARTQAKRAVLTNLHIDMDYDVLAAELPPVATPAYDGMIVSPA